MLAQKKSVITASDRVFLAMERVFGASGKMRHIQPPLLYGEMHQIIGQLSREPFISDAMAVIVKELQSSISNLVSFSANVIDQSGWERAADTTVVNTEDGLSAEVNFCTLIRHFVGGLGTKVLMGHDFMANNPDIVSDIFTLDASFIPLLAGYPFFYPGVASGRRARARLTQAMIEHQQALYAILDGRDPGIKWGDMSDVAGVMKDRAKGWRERRAEPDLFGPGDAPFVLAMNANANQIVFWVLYYVYQQPSLRSEILDEIAAYVQPVKEPSDLPVPEAPRLSIDLKGLLRNCPLLKGVYLETLRLEAAGPSFTTVRETFTVTESTHDAAAEGKDQPQTYIFPRGANVLLPHHVHAMDEGYFRNPTSFNPRRFWLSSDDVEKSDSGDVDGKTDGKNITVSLGSLQIFGGGLTMCKGRLFAEREILCMTAAILTSWDVEPVKGKWPALERGAGSGSHIPKRDVRVRMTRRPLET